MKKTLLLIIILFHFVLKSQTFNGNLGSQSLNWTLEQKDFNSPPRAGISPMSIKLWDNYNGLNAPSQYGSLLEINGRESHLVSQLYFTGFGERIQYRSAFYNQNSWDTWRYLLDSKSDVESTGNLKITGTGNSYLSNGNLSIGTESSSFQTKLYVRESGSSNSIWRGRIVASGDINAIVLGEYDGKALLAAHNAQLNAWSDLILQGGGGNVGIGTLNPTSKLESLNTTAGLTSFKTVGTNGYLLIDNVGSGENYYSANKFQEFQINGISKMRIDANGNVGIGTINPLNKLDVKGTIHSQEVKVDMNGWSDFVFKKDYNLPTLTEVEKHIQEKGHLENIPSEEEVLKNGINLGEMNSKLLQKIEELTLYMIEQNKEIKELKKENESFKSVLSRISKSEDKL